MTRLDEVVDPPVRDGLLNAQASGSMISLVWEKWYQRLPDLIKKTPSCLVTTSGAETITTSTQTRPDFDTEDHDNAGMHDTVTNSDRITVPSSGVYHFGGSLVWEPNATGTRWAMLSVNSTATFAAYGAVLSLGAVLVTPVHVAHHQELSGGDIVRLTAWQDSGGDLDIQKSTWGPWFWCFKVSK